MNWRGSQDDSRRRYLEKFDTAEAERYDAVVGALACEDEDAYRSDLAGALPLAAGMQVLDAGAGTGTLTRILARCPGLGLTALEPAPAMLARLRARPELRGVAAIAGFCDAAADRSLFAPGRFDVIASRQLVNGLYDPLAAFANWHGWLKPGGAVLVIDGLYQRAAWSGAWAEEVDVLPVAACQSTALVPYLLEQGGFSVEAVRLMDAVNRRPSTRTPRYLVVARKRG
jgi:ubiquinone/menaquinone biosynthesis C-methylase UbiE